MCASPSHAGGLGTGRASPPPLEATLYRRTERECLAATQEFVWTENDSNRKQGSPSTNLASRVLGVKLFQPFQPKTIGCIAVAITGSLMGCISHRFSCNF